MNTNRMLMVPALAAAVALQGCLEVKTSTKVNTDGSLERTIQVKGDSTEIAKGKRLMGIDSTWTLAVLDSAGKAVGTTAAKTVQDAADLSQRDAAERWVRFSHDVTLERDFRWFTTEYTFRETYFTWNPFDTIPLTRYFSESEIANIKKHFIRKEPFESVEDSVALKAMESRGEEWIARNFFETFYGDFLAGVRILNDPARPAAAVDSLKETIFRTGLEKLDEPDPSVMVVPFEKVLGKDFTRRVMGANPAGFARFERRADFYKDANLGSYKNSLSMPGVVTETNAPTVEGNTVTWNDYKGLCYLDDYEMWVQSRVVNWWAVVVTALAVVGAGAVLLVGTLRRRVPAAV